MDTVFKSNSSMTSIFARLLVILLGALAGASSPFVLGQFSLSGLERTGDCNIISSPLEDAELANLYSLNYQPLLITQDAVISCSCLPGRRLAGATESRQLAGNTEERTLSGATEERALAGATETRELFGDTESRSLAGDTEERSLAGDQEERQIAGNTEARSLAGDIENRSLAGDTEARSLAGDTETRSLAGDQEIRALAGATEERSLAGNTEDRQLSGAISGLYCGISSACDGIALSFGRAVQLYDSYSYFPIENSCIN